MNIELIGGLVAAAAIGGGVAWGLYRKQITTGVDQIKASQQKIAQVTAVEEQKIEQAVNAELAFIGQAFAHASDRAHALIHSGVELEGDILHYVEHLFGHTVPTAAHNDDVTVTAASMAAAGPLGTAIGAAAVAVASETDKAA